MRQSFQVQADHTVQLFGPFHKPPIQFPLSITFHEVHRPLHMHVFRSVLHEKSPLQLPSYTFLLNLQSHLVEDTLLGQDYHIPW